MTRRQTDRQTDTLQYSFSRLAAVKYRNITLHYQLSLIIIIDLSLVIQSFFLQRFRRQADLGVALRQHQLPRQQDRQRRRDGRQGCPEREGSH